jgi:hypothetical protein
MLRCQQMAGGRGIYATAEVLSMRKKIRGAKLRKLPDFHTKSKKLNILTVNGTAPVAALGGF